MDIKEFLTEKLNNDKHTQSNFYSLSKKIAIVFMVFAGVYPIIKYLMETNFGSDYNAPFFTTGEVIYLALWCSLSYFLILHLKNLRANNLAKKVGIIILLYLTLYAYTHFLPFDIIFQFMTIYFVLKTFIEIVILVLSLNLAYNLKMYKSDYIGGLKQLGQYYIFFSIIYFVVQIEKILYTLAYNDDFVFMIFSFIVKLLIVLQAVSAILYSRALYKVFDSGQKYIERQLD